MRSLHLHDLLLSIYFVTCTFAFTEVRTSTTTIWSKASSTRPYPTVPINNIFGRTVFDFCSRDHHRTATVVCLTPLYDLETPISFLSSPDSYRTCIDSKGVLNSDDDESQSPYVICVAEEDDLPAISKMIIESFGSEAIQMSGDLSPFEQAFLEPGVGLLNAYSGAIAYAEVLSE